MNKNEMKALLRTVGYEAAKALGCSIEAWLGALTELLEEEKQRSTKHLESVNLQRN